MRHQTDARSREKGVVKDFGPERIRLYWLQGYNRILYNETANAPARLGSIFEGNLIVGPVTSICHLYGLSIDELSGKSRGVRETDLDCCVSDIYNLL